MQAYILHTCKDIWYKHLNLIINTQVHKSNPLQTFSNITLILSSVLIVLFQASYDNGIFPDNCKAARVKQKKKPITVSWKYKPVSHLSIISKVKESVINSNIFKYLETRIIHDSADSVIKDLL